MHDALGRLCPGVASTSLEWNVLGGGFTNDYLGITGQPRLYPKHGLIVGGVATNDKPLGWRGCWVAPNGATLIPAKSQFSKTFSYEAQNSRLNQQL